MIVNEKCCSELYQNRSFTAILKVAEYILDYYLVYI